MLIYKVTNKINGCIYIGQTTLTLQERRYKHEQDKKDIIKVLQNMIKCTPTIQETV